MIKLEYTSVLNFEGAVRAMRNPMNSWEKSDSFIGCGIHDHYPYCGESCKEACHFVAGENDLKLMKKLAKAGSDHRKFMRQIFVSVDITAPLYWWKEFDTYKVGTVANSTSTMHTIHKKEFELDDISTDHLSEWGKYVLDTVIDFLELCRIEFNETKDKTAWYDIISLLPSGYLQKRTVTMNYENLVKMYHARKNHKLDEWHEFCDWIKELPYSEIITGVKE